MRKVLRVMGFELGRLLYFWFRVYCKGLGAGTSES